MDRFVYVAAAGAKDAMLQQAVNAHNLANAPTIGFKADLIESETLYLRGAGRETRAYKRVREIAADFSGGPLTRTGRDLDIAIAGAGWIAVQDAGGGEGLTRRGDLRIDEFGQLLNGAGQVVLGNNGPVALPPFSSMSIAADGTISIVPLGEPPGAVAVLDRIKLVNPPVATLGKNERGVMLANDGLPSVADGTVRITTGSLENSNVNAVSAMVRMIELSREFEQFMKMAKVAEEIDTSSARLMQLA